MTPEQEIAKLQMEVAALKRALGSFITWTAQSANSPITVDEASRARMVGVIRIAPTDHPAHRQARP